MKIPFSSNRKKLIKYLSYLSLLLVVFVFSACGSDYSSSYDDNTGSYDCSIKWPADVPTLESSNSVSKAIDCAATNVATVVFTFYDGSDNYLTSAAFDCTAHSGTVSGIPPGTDRRLVVTGEDSGGTVLYRGEQTGITIVAGQTTQGGEIQMVWCGPTATTGSATLVTSSSATLNGTVNPNGASTTYYFEYGTTASYGTTTTSTSAGSGTTAVSVSDGISGLSPNTTYHFRIVATNSAGTAYGLDQSFSTIVDAPTNVNATPGDGQVTISWDSVSGATSYNIYWATYTGVSKANNEGIIYNATSPYTHTALTNDITYYYVVTAENSYGESDESVEVSATPVDTTPPTVTVTSPSDGETEVSVDTVISITFSEAIDTSTVTTNTTDTICSGTIQLSSDNFSSCVQMLNSPTASNGNKTFTVSPSSELSFITIYNIIVTTDIKDTSNNNLAGSVIIGFSTENEGNLDSTFGTNGIVQHDNAAGGNGTDRGFALTLDPNGRIIVGGYSYNGTDYDATIWRYNSDGTVDTTFGLNGYVTHDSAAGGNGFDGIYDITTDSNGNIYAVGCSINSSNYTDMVIWKYDSSGNLDNSFGANGIVVRSGDTGGTEDDVAKGITIDSNGKIFVTGYGREPSNMLYYMIIWSFDSNGQLDSNFSSDGIVVYQSYYGQGYAITTDSSGKILVVGEGNTCEMLIWRYNSNGTPDNTFDSDGLANYRPDPVCDTNAYGKDILVDSNGKILVSGYIEDARADMAIWRYNSNGTLDNTFNSDGLVTYDGGAGMMDDYGTAIAIDNKGNILIAGSSWDTSQFDMVLFRYAANGILDSSFGTNGIARYDQLIDSNEEEGQDIIIDSNGNIFVAGWSVGISNLDMTIWKYKASK